MKPSYLPCSQELATGPNPEADESSLRIPTQFPSKAHSSSIRHSMSRSSSGLFPSGFPTKILHAFLISALHVTCPAHIILLDLITLVISTYSSQVNGIALGYGLDNRWFESCERLGIFLFTIVSRAALGPIQHPIL